MGNAEDISTPPLSCRPHDEFKRDAIEQEVAVKFKNWACKCLCENVGNLLVCRNFKQAQNFEDVQFADEMLLQFEVFISSADLRTGYHGSARCIVFVQQSWRQFYFWQQKSNE